jgi:uncharacterized protein YjbI with pentapeptide repeats
MANEEHLARLKQGVKTWNQWRAEHPEIQSDLRVADLTRMELANVDLHDANLAGANLRQADLRQADLSAANLTGAELVGAKLNKATIGWTTLGNVDLNTVQGLETVQHKGPSSIGIDTLYLSNGQIPEVFLRGAGVPENFITYIKSLVGHPFEFYSCFISYSSKDQEFAERLYADL